ncbi:MAG: aldehyde dehydrogenase family protein, partial [Thermoleophilaceae bacterium]|nr:aldehyde dehydrogenase family protein [Thermoleophilaceae bacterium]
MDPAVEQQAVANVPTGALIGGQWVQTGSTVAVTDPSNGQTLAEIADCGSEQAMAALDAAAAAQPAWAAYAPRARSEILRNVFEQMTARVDELALVMTLEMGKPLAESRSEVL